MKTTTESRRLDYLLLLALAIIWSGSFPLIKVAVESIPPFTLTAGRLVIAAVIFWIILGLRGEGIPMHRSALSLYVAVGILGNCLPFVLISWGETQISSSLTAILMGIMPIVTFVLAHLFVSEEPMTRFSLAGISLGFCGLLVLVGFGALSGVGGAVAGQLSVLGGATCYALATIYVRTHETFEGYKMAAGMNTAAAIISVALAFLVEDPLAVQPRSDGLVTMALLGIFPTAVASLMYFRVIKALGATTFSQINYIIPVLGGIWGVLFLGEVLRWNVFVALGLVLCGLFLIQHRPRPTDPPRP